VSGVSTSALPRPRWRRFAWLWSLIWLAYLLPPLVTLWGQPGAVVRWLGSALIIAFGVVFVTSFAMRRRAGRRDTQLPALGAAALVVVGAALVVGTAIVLRTNTLQMLAFVAVMAIFLLPARWGPAVVLGLIVGTLAAEHALVGWSSRGATQFQIFASALAMWGVLQLVTRNSELAAAREEIAQLAVEQERTRFARDLHDILGHSLTVVSVKAELASRLVTLDPARAAAEMDEVQRLSRQALADVREAVAGYRVVSLSGSLASARSALAAAGIDAELPASADDVPAERRELFGWVIREGVTNVVRHSGASRCWVALSPSTVEILDDGRGPQPGTAGTGLRGLRERVDAAGGTLTVGHREPAGFRLRVSL
jgi:two-component system, NarL family, sensor histidine kinase DesK